MNTEKLLEEHKKYAEENGFKLNPNAKLVEAVLKGLARNEDKFGYQYCPCRRVTGNEEEDKKIICPCDYHKEEINEKGHCHCMLFMKK
ncbi:MAG: ferredoxin-thioredoxin reductase catalytic domain-containing protein [Nanobdellota archaeon]